MSGIIAAKAPQFRSGELPRTVRELCEWAQKTQLQTDYIVTLLRRKGITTDAEIKNAGAQTAALDGQIQAVLSQMSQTAAQIDGIGAKIDALSESTENRLKEYGERITALEAKITALEGV